jgi:hypothetical protein
MNGNFGVSNQKDAVNIQIEPLPSSSFRRKASAEKPRFIG